MMVGTLMIVFVGISLYWLITTNTEISGRPAFLLSFIPATALTFLYFGAANVTGKSE